MTQPYSHSIKPEKGWEKWHVDARSINFREQERPCYDSMQQWSNGCSNRLFGVSKVPQQEFYNQARTRSGSSNPSSTRQVQLTKLMMQVPDANQFR